MRGESVRGEHAEAQRGGARRDRRAAVDAPFAPARDGAPVGHHSGQGHAMTTPAGETPVPPPIPEPVPPVPGPDPWPDPIPDPVPPTP
jgi:hypothetical protein